MAHETRRTLGARTTGRSARVVGEVLRAALEEVGRVGYAALRVGDVAQRAGVHKTSVYRRWPTRFELVAAALQEFSDTAGTPDTGSLRGDLLTLLRGTTARAAGPAGRGILRLINAERALPEVERLVAPFIATALARRRTVVERAILRGELPEDTDAELVAELTFAPVIRRIVNVRRPADDAFIESTVDVVLAGARTGAARRKPHEDAARGRKKS